MCIRDRDVLNSKVEGAVQHLHELQKRLQETEQRMADISELRTQIIHYARTREVYAAYRKSGYSKKFLAEHEGDILLHKTAKAFFDKQNLNKLPRVKDLNAEYEALKAQKKELYPEYRRAREEMQQLLRAQKNLERFFADAPSRLDQQQSR